MYLARMVYGRTITVYALRPEGKHQPRLWRFGPRSESGFSAIAEAPEEAAAAVRAAATRTPPE